eukprot:9320630-Lingulodinium_polyedra.AAC.1
MSLKGQNVFARNLRRRATTLCKRSSCSSLLLPRARPAPQRPPTHGGPPVGRQTPRAALDPHPIPTP